MQSIKSISNRVTIRLLKYWFQVNVKKNINVENPPTLISSNCIGGRVYQAAQLAYLSPTIGMWFEADSFYKLVTNLRYYLSLELKESKSDYEYPMATLGDIQIHLMHYKSFNDALVAWNRRISRVNYSNIIVINTDRDGCDEYKLKRIHEESPFKIISFVAGTKYNNYDWILSLKPYAKEDSVGDLYTNYHHLAFNFPYKVLRNE